MKEDYKQKVGYIKGKQLYEKIKAIMMQNTDRISEINEDPGIIEELLFSSEEEA